MVMCSRDLLWPQWKLRHGRHEGIRSRLVKVSVSFLMPFKDFLSIYMAIFARYKNIPGKAFCQV